MTDTPGRACPIHYRYRAGELAHSPVVRGDAAWVAGGLYGNMEALRAIRERVETERAGGAKVPLVFNGDFHWFDADPEDFLMVQKAVQAEAAITGNVELELAQPHPGAGCGCAYPDFVDDGTVVRSNRIMERLRETAARTPGGRETLDGLLRLIRLEVGGTTTGVVHGDPESVAGWRFAYESVTDPVNPLSTREVRSWAEAGGVRAFACTHTCLPWAARFGDTVVINNGSAGMPNFRGDRRVLVTRIAPAGSRHPDALYGIEHGGARWEAVAVDYDETSWLERFRRVWPPGSPAHKSYHDRLTRGPVHWLADITALASV